MQYLLNASIIWLLSLLAFELFFKRETVHRLNRVYLLSTLLLGFLLPLWRWNHGSAVVLDAMPRVRQVVTAPSAAVHAVMAQSHVAAVPYNWMAVLYSCGVVLSVGLLLRTVTACYRLQRGGIRHRHNGYTVIETGKQHGPFSFFHFVFISSVAQYSKEELALVLRHELRHARLWHSVDVLLLQLLKVVLWFHPLVYWYDKRLRMVHEYEADVAERENAGTYGQFLIEQALLQPAPAFTNTLTHLPIKNRIMMLMRRKTSHMGLMKYLVVLPMLLFFGVACTQHKQLPEKIKTGDRVYFKGNEFELANRKGWGNEYIRVALHGTDADIRVVDSIPVKMNGEKIYTADELSQQPVYQGPDNSAADHILGQLHNSLTELNDGEYVIWVTDVVLDKTGHIAYYKYSGILTSSLIDINGDRVVAFEKSVKAIAVKSEGKDKEDAIKKLKEYNTQKAISESESESHFLAINQKALELINSADLHYTPAILNGKPVATYLDEQFDFYNSHKIRVRNHQVDIINTGLPVKIFRYP